MLFNTPAFIFVYFPIVFAGAFFVGRFSHRLAILWLALSSLAFYAIWNPRFLILLLASVAMNYGASCWILATRAQPPQGSRLPVATAIVANLGVLFYFKYSNFFLSSSNQWFGTGFTALDVVLPLGISFFTFTQITFLVDVHRGVSREYNFWSYLLFVTYFPHLIAGPILHHSQMMPQFADAQTFRINHTNISVGLTAFILGLAKKVLLADMLAPHATLAFDLAARRPEDLHLLHAWMGAIAYALQLYFDFSGYCDMAIGLSLMFNVRLPLNFNSPYKATSIINFWSRWHITLSEFLRSYLYIPLGGNRRGPKRRYLNLMVTMVLGGLWHGAGWTYIVWGALHGIYLMVNHGWRAIQSRSLGNSVLRLPQAVERGLTLLAVLVAWVFFRSNNLNVARSMLFSMVAGNGISVPHGLATILAPLAFRAPWLHLSFEGLAPGGRSALILIGLGLILVWFFPNVPELLAQTRRSEEGPMFPGVPSTSQSDVTTLQNLTWKLTPPFAILAGAIFVVSFLFMLSSKVSEFLYFEF
jgi:alginate O-acetyltransferase complex protein AlgI